MSVNPNSRPVSWALLLALSLLGIGLFTASHRDHPDAAPASLAVAKPGQAPVEGQVESSGTMLAGNPNVPVATGSVAEASAHFEFSPDADLPADFMERMVSGNTASFGLPDGRSVRTRIELMERDAHGLLFIQGSFRAPEPGFFYFHRQTAPGVAGPFFGHVRFTNNPEAWKIEPNPDLATAKLVKRRIDDVMCVNYSKPPEEGAIELGDTANAPQTHPSDLATVPLPPHQNIIPLQSLPGAVAVAYLDFDGETGPFSGWGSFDAAPTNATDTQIYDVWKMVAEDFQGFTINVTTDRKVYDAAPEGRRIHCIVTPTTTAAPGAGGVAYVGSFNSTGKQVCWAFISTGKSSAEVISHEIGHTLRLLHDGRTSPVEEYYRGHGTDPTGWAPIMGSAYTKRLSQWSKGEYLNANRTQDDLAIIATNNNSVAYRADDRGDTLATASYLEISATNTVSNEGIIERTGDVDAFRFVTTGGLATLNVNPASLNPNLDILAEIVDAATSTVVATSNPDLNINATFSTTLTAGEYLLRIRGTGRGDPLGNGYTNYGSLGSYLISGSVVGGIKPERFTIAENSAAGTAVGTVLPRNNHEGAALTYAIASGNGSGTFAINASTGAITVADPAALNYESLSLRWDDPSTIELFVTITNAANPALDETLRTVVTVANVNEPSTITGGSVTMLEKTLVGTPVFKVNGSDPDRFDFPTYSITAGNTGNAFAINSGTGQITVAANIDISAQTVYTLTIQATDKGTPVNSVTTTVTITVVNITDGYQPGRIVRTYFEGISGSTVANLTGATSKFPNNPDSEEFLTNFDGGEHGNNYGSTIRGYVIPPVTGSYRFWIASDDSSALLISTGTNPANATSRATVSGSTGAYVWGTGTQQSALITLSGGQPYYIEARHKEGSGADHVSVAWSGPTITKQLLSGLYLAPFYQNYAPKVTATTFNVRENTLPPRSIGTVAITDVNQQDTFSNYTITAGNIGNVFGINPSTGSLFVAQSGVLNAVTRPSYTLTIQVTDNGSPALVGTGTVTVNVAPAGTISIAGVTQEIWTGITGSTLTNLTGNTNYPFRPGVRRTLTSFDSGANYADNYGSRIRALFTPPESGDYRFYISGDDDCRLLFSTNTSGAGATAIATISGWSAVAEWTKFPSQTSSVRTLVAGQPVYLEALHKEGGGGDHVMVGYTSPSTTTITVIPGSMLQPFNINAAPNFDNSPYLFTLNGPAAVVGTAVGTASATEPNAETLTYAITSGNTSGIFAINSANGAITIANPAPLANGDVTLQVSAQDSGLGATYPLATATASVVVRVSGFNVAPVFATNPVSKPNATEDLSYSQTLAGSATDANAGDTVTYSKISGPSWLNVAANGVLTGTPLEANTGANAFVVRATDGGGLFAEATLNIQVIAVNETPSLTSAPPNSSMLRDIFYQFTATATDPDVGDVVTFSKSSGPAWLSVAPNGSITGTPNAANAGANSFVLRATDSGGLFAQATFTITVVNNPTWTNPAGGSWPVIGNWLAGIPANAAGLVADFSTLNLTGNAVVSLNGSRSVGHLVFADTTPSHDWSIVAGTGGVLQLATPSGTPSITVGNRSATISPVLSGNQGFIKNGAGTLALTGSHAYTGPTTIAEGTLSLTGTLPSGNASVAPGATITGTGTINGPLALSGTLAPGNQGVGILTLNQSLTLNTGSNIDWQISDWNGAAGTGFDQILCASWNATATPAAKAIIRISGSTLTNFTESGKSFVLANTATTVTDFDPAAFEIDATGFTAGLGTWSIAASGTDVLLVYTRFNTTPELGAAPASFTATEDQPFAASISATDPDLNETLSYTKSSGPDWVSVSPSGVISGTPGNADVGNQSLTIAVTDSFNATNSRSINLLVENVNDAPVFSTNPISATSATEDASYAYDISSFASDPDAAELLVFSKISGPTWLDLTASGNLTGTPLNEHVGPHSIVVRVTDAGGLWVETTVNLEVVNTNDAPLFLPPGLAPQTATEGRPVTGTLAGSAADPDAGDSLTYSKFSGPAWLDVAASGALSGTPASTDAGSQSFVIRATDAAGLIAEATLLIEVTALDPDANSNGIDDAWEIVKFGNANENAHPATGDEDGDGLSNILEFALDTHPAIGNPSPLTSSFVESEDGLVLQLSIPKNPLAENLVYTVEATNDLAQGPWSSATTVVVSDTPTQRIVRDTQARSSNTNRFLRLKVTTVP